MADYMMVIIKTTGPMAAGRGNSAPDRSRVPVTQGYFALPSVRSMQV
jgi:hypothetical protein